MWVYSLVAQWTGARVAILGEHGKPGLDGNYKQIARDLLLRADRTSRQQSYLCDKYVCTPSIALFLMHLACECNLFCCCLRDFLASDSAACLSRATDSYALQLRRPRSRKFDTHVAVFPCYV